MLEIRSLPHLPTLFTSYLVHYTVPFSSKQALAKTGSRPSQWHSEPDGGQFRELMPGAEGNNERSPWNMERAYALPGFAEEMRFWHELRVKLLPYLLKTARECAAENRPMLRPLVYYWPGDARAADCADEFLLGRDILVAPLLEENSASRRVYLPEGEWRDFFTGEAHVGPAELVCP